MCYLFRPNAPISALFDDVPMECIEITDEAIAEYITTYHGRYIVDKQDFDIAESNDLFSWLVPLFDNGHNLEYDDNIVAWHTRKFDGSYEDFCKQLIESLQDRKWVVMQTDDVEQVDRFCRSNLEQFHFPKKAE